MPLAISHQQSSWPTSFLVQVLSPPLFCSSSFFCLSVNQGIFITSPNLTLQWPTNLLARLAVNGTYYLDDAGLTSSSRPDINRYACASGSKFVGCCMSDPCSTGCGQGNIRQAGFNASDYGKFPDASCGLASDFYTCSSGKTFWGCCKSPPCSDDPTCPDGGLVPAFMERPEQFNFYAASQTVTDATSTSGATASSTASGNGSSKSNGAVIGGAVGGALGGVLIIGLIIFFLFRRRRGQQTARGETVEVASPMMGGKAFDSSSTNFVAQSRKCTPNKPWQSSSTD